MSQRKCEDYVRLKAGIRIINFKANKRTVSELR
jgi:hypothetical protein